MKNHKAILLVASTFTFACAGAQQQPKALVASSSCQQLPASEKMVQQVYSPGTIFTAEPVKKKTFKARASQRMQTYGASLFVHAEPGMTAEYMERVLQCHAEYGAPAHPNDPLHPSSGNVVKLSVEPASASFAIRVVGDTTNTGREIWQRAQVISGGSTQVEAEQVGDANVEDGTAKF